jgi:hypothetical protein
MSEPVMHTDSPGPPRVRSTPATSSKRRRALLEIAVIATFYFAYSAVRNGFGSGAVDPEIALRNAHSLVEMERSIGLFFEPSLQTQFIDHRWFIWTMNVFYGTFHFIVTPAVLAWMFVRHPARYRVWRNALAFTTAIAIVGFSLFPVMPPRLLADCGPLGGCSGPVFVDTIAQVGGLWSFDSGLIQSVSNQYAAVPSLHIAWALWCAIVLWPRVRSWPGRALALVYPIATLFATLVTANHFWIDAVFGAFALAVGMSMA